jgi:D-alanyl-D-alanine carboxypeptidase (penicillin-binding protein 5/6)
MQFPDKVHRLFIISICVIILALAANEGAKDIPRPLHSLEPTTRYPSVPLDLDPNALVKDPPFPVATPFIQAKSTSSPIVVKPTVSAEAYLVANLETSQIYNEHNGKHVYPIASLSKLITALVAIHHMNPDQKITITEPMLEAYGDAGHLVLGEKYTVSELLYPLLLESSNDAAEAIAQSYGYANFISEMNKFTAGLGMSSTAFHDASGLSSENVSNAEDLFTLAKYIYTNEKPLLDVTRQTTYAVASTTDHGAHVWKTINPFPYDPHFIGGKTGRTVEAKESMLSLFRYSTAGVSYPVAVIVLRSDFSVREVDSSYLFGQFIQKVGGI